MSSVIAIEAGGTKFVLAWGSSPFDLHDKTVIPTTTPEQTMALVVDYIQRIQSKTEIIAIGAGVFGPLDLNRSSANYGCITASPKLAWCNFNFVEYLKRACGLPVGFDTDVNAAALAEDKWGVAQDVSSLVYMTVGTGIGCGAVFNGRLQRGVVSSEMGHMLIPKHPHDAENGFDGICPYHNGCLEAMASGPSLQSRWLVESAEELLADHIAWDIEADYLAAAVMNISLLISPAVIVISGGVLQQEHLITKIRKLVLSKLGSYLGHVSDTTIDKYIMPSSLQGNAGVLGAVLLGFLAVKGE